MKDNNRDPWISPWLHSDKGAIISDDQLFRYALWCVWDRSRLLVGWTCQNPSTADAESTDPSLTKMIGFSKRLGFGGLLLGNLGAWRETNGKLWLRAADPVGPENDAWLRRMAADVDVMICAWGRQPKKLDARIHDVEFEFSGTGVRTVCLGRTQDGCYPRHPLMLAYSAEVLPWRTE
jgi:hypothetical protein